MKRLISLHSSCIGCLPGPFVLLSSSSLRCTRGLAGGVHRLVLTAGCFYQMGRGLVLSARCVFFFAFCTPPRKQMKFVSYLSSLVGTFREAFFTASAPLLNTVVALPLSGAANFPTDLPRSLKRLILRPNRLREPGFLLQVSCGAACRATPPRFLQPNLLLPLTHTTIRCRVCGDANHTFGGGAVPAGGESGVASEVRRCFRASVIAGADGCTVVFFHPVCTPRTGVLKGECIVMFCSPMRGFWSRHLMDANSH